MLYNDGQNAIKYTKSQKVGVIVSGTRSVTDKSEVIDLLDDVMREYKNNDSYDITFITGGAFGVDAIAYQYATDHKFENIMFRAKWDKYYTDAGYIRNSEMLKFLNSGIFDIKILIAIKRTKELNNELVHTAIIKDLYDYNEASNNVMSGTSHMIAIAEDSNEVEIYSTKLKLHDNISRRSLKPLYVYDLKDGVTRFIPLYEIGHDILLGFKLSSESDDIGMMFASPDDIIPKITNLIGAIPVEYNTYRALISSGEAEMMRGIMYRVYSILII